MRHDVKGCILDTSDADLFFQSANQLQIHLVTLEADIIVNINREFRSGCIHNFTVKFANTVRIMLVIERSDCGYSRNAQFFGMARQFNCRAGVRSSDMYN